MSDKRHVISMRMAGSRVEVKSTLERRENYVDDLWHDSFEDKKLVS
jgi:hypothetical protein